MNLFVSQTKEHEKEFINNKIKIQNLKEWLSFKTTIQNLYQMYPKSPQTIFEKNGKEYLRLLNQLIGKIETQYRDRINENTLKTILYQMRVLCLYNHLVSSKKELEINQFTTGEKTIEIQDVLGKTYTIEEKNRPIFIQINDLQKKMYPEFFQVYTCVYGNRKEKLELVAKYEKQMENCKLEILEGKINITTLEQWNQFKNNILSFRENYNAIFENLRQVEHFHISTLPNKIFFDIFCKSINNIEKKYNGQINEKDIPFLVEILMTICHYHAILEQKDKIIVTSRNRTDVEKIAVINSLQQRVSIDTALAVNYQELEKKQQKLIEKYKEAYAFVFENLEGEVEEKRAI